MLTAGSEGVSLTPGSRVAFRTKDPCRPGCRTDGTFELHPPPQEGNKPALPLGPPAQGVQRTRSFAKCIRCCIVHAYRYHNARDAAE